MHAAAGSLIAGRFGGARWPGLHAALASTAMETIAATLRALAAVDADLARTPAQLGATVATETEPHAGTVHGARHTVLLEPLLLALPLTRTFLLAAASAGLVEVALPDDGPQALHELLVGHGVLTQDHATNLVDLVVDALEQHLQVRPDPQAGLAEDAHALAHLDLAIADAVADARSGLAAAVGLTIATFDALAGAEELAQRLGRLGLAETAALVAATAG